MEQSKTSLYTKIINSVPKILRLMDTFTFWKIVIFIFFLLFSMTGFSLWENRSLIIDQFIQNDKTQSWEVSEKTKKSIQQEVNDNPNVAWILVTEMDLGANLRKFKFWYNEDHQLDAKLIFNLKQTSNRQIFDFDRSHTNQMISVLQNEFICEPFENTTLFSRVPELEQQTDYVCKIAIPPFYGRFVGMLAIGVKGPIDDEVKFNIKAIASNIAATIYWRDVIKLPR
jgi:uncharacterized membrane protein